MTYQTRAEIFSKEALSIEDMMLLTGKGYSMAAKIMRDLKRRSDRLQIDKGVFSKLQICQQLVFCDSSFFKQFFYSFDKHSFLHSYKITK